MMDAGHAVVSHRTYTRAEALAPSFSTSKASSYGLTLHSPFWHVRAFRVKISSADFCRVAESKKNQPSDLSAYWTAAQSGARIIEEIRSLQGRVNITGFQIPLSVRNAIYIVIQWIRP